MSTHGPRGVDDLDAIGESILTRLEAKHGRREKVLDYSRHLVQHAARAIRAIHREEWEKAQSTIGEATGILGKMMSAAADYPDLASAGYTMDAQKEYAEAHLTWALVRGEALPSPGDLEVSDAAWLNGLGEAGGELRRRALDLIRRGDIAEAEAVLTRMEDIHTFLSTVDFPSAITRDVRRTNDMVRGVTERTRGDLTVAVRQEEMKAALDRFEQRVATGE